MGNEQETTKIICNKDCPLHSLSRKNVCAYLIVLELPPMNLYKEEINYGEPCMHPEAFSPIDLFRTPEGNLVHKTA